MSWVAGKQGLMYLCHLGGMWFGVVVSVSMAVTHTHTHRAVVIIHSETYIF